MGKWNKTYWASQPEPKPGTRAHFGKYGGPSTQHVIDFIALVCVAGLILWALYYGLTLPIVYESYTTGNCVRVDDVRGVYSCENMPRKYHHQWTQ